MFEFEACEVFKIKEFTFVNDCFKDEHNEEIGHYVQTLTSLFFKVTHGTRPVLITIYQDQDFLMFSSFEGISREAGEGCAQLFHRGSFHIIKILLFVMPDILFKYYL